MLGAVRWGVGWAGPVCRGIPREAPRSAQGPGLSSCPDLPG